MTQEQINKCVALAIEARKIIKELRDAGLVKDSYNTIMVAGLNGIEKMLKRSTPCAD
ncbi:hypothetical protein [Massilia suwonensis]|uniref:Uncharacterized protein n=1 Tax=Massilia suwonensis TaxID=648895 RepID=A0ABW0MQQ4_9BURK